MPKRKILDDLPPIQDEIHANGLEMQSEDEADDSGPDSDGEEVDVFPEIDPASDSEDPSESEADSEDEDDSEAESSSDTDSHHIFPVGKTVISDITGEPKIVYPEIEPDYDSDSSTEDVRVLKVLIQFFW